MTHVRAHTLADANPSKVCSLASGIVLLLASWFDNALQFYKMLPRGNQAMVTQDLCIIFATSCELIILPK